MFRTPKSFASTINNNKARMDNVTSIEATTTGVMIFVSILLLWNGQYVGLAGMVASIAAYYFTHESLAHVATIEQYFENEELHAIKDIRLAQEAHKQAVDEVMSLTNGNTVVRCLYLAFGLAAPSLFLHEMPGIMIAVSFSFAAVTVINALYGYLTLARMRGSRSYTLTMQTNG